MKPVMFTRYVKGSLALILGICGAHASAQAPKEDLFKTVKPQVSVVVHKHPTGADLVDVTVLDPKYPSQLLQTQVEAMCSELNAPARGLSLRTVSFRQDNSHLDFLRASFGTIGLIGGSGKFNIQPIVKAFAGTPAPYTITGVSITFDGEKATSDTLGELTGPMVKVQARANQAPDPGVEFRVELTGQDPKQIVIPDHSVPVSPVTPAPAPRQAPDWPLWLMLGIAAVAVGALVYLALLRMPSNGRKTPPGANPK